VAAHEEGEAEHHDHEPDQRHEREQVRDLPARVVRADLGQLLDLVVARVLLRVQQVVDEEQRRRGDQGRGRRPAVEAGVRGRLAQNPRRSRPMRSTSAASRPAACRWRTK
jgi:hypothetical protein